MKYNSLILLLLLANLSIAQNSATAKIKAVSQNGLHKIVLPPEIRSLSKQDISDFRIFDANKNEVPYFLIRSQNETETTSFDEYKIISKTVIPKKSTTVIIEILSAQNYREISLFIANSDVIKSCSISGSDDQKEWFGLSNAHELYNLDSNTKTYAVKTISLPLCSYKFLKIELDDKKTLPINILRAGNFNNKTQSYPLHQIVLKSFTVAELTSKKETLLHIAFDAPQVINQVTFEISKPNLYTRNAVLFINGIRKLKHKTEPFIATIANFELSSDSKSTFNIPEIFDKDFFIKIYNEDNQPLTITAVKCMQIPVSIIADLSANEEYTVKTGNPNLGAPQYDLSNFKNNISKNLPETSIYEIKKITVTANVFSAKSFWQQSWFMWTCIILGGIAILYFTASLVKDMKSAQSKSHE